MQKPSKSHLGGVLGRPGRILRRLAGVLGRLGGVLARLAAVLEAAGAVLEASWAVYFEIALQGQNAMKSFLFYIGIRGTC